MYFLNYNFIHIYAPEGITESYFCSVTKSCPSLCNSMDHSMPGFPVLHHLMEFSQTHDHRIGDTIQPPHPLLSPSPPSFNLFQHQSLFQWAGSSYQVAKVSSFRFSISPSNEYSGLIFFGIDWSYLLAVQGTHKSLLQHHNSKVLTFWRSAFFRIQLSHPYLTTGKAIALTIQTFINKVIFLLFNMLSRFFIAFLPRSKCLLISQLQSLSTVILEPNKINSGTVSLVSPSIYLEVMGSDAMIFIFWMLSC